jgi:hypothetical protein
LTAPAYEVRSRSIAQLRLESFNPSGHFTPSVRRGAGASMPYRMLT